uniref:WW domain binding protein VOPP1 n=1 Tax=Lates calcarifer TaxID=8187 RepID=A0A4W6EN94_LATCA
TARSLGYVAFLTMTLICPSLLQCVEAKKYCWYFEGGYPIYFICRSYEDCCGTRCFTVWAVVLLMMGVLFCCGAGFFIRRRMYPSPLRDEPAFNRLLHQLVISITVVHDTSLFIHSSHR